MRHKREILNVKANRSISFFALSHHRAPCTPGTVGAWPGFSEKKGGVVSHCVKQRVFTSFRLQVVSYFLWNGLKRGGGGVHGHLRPSFPSVTPLNSPVKLRLVACWFSIVFGGIGREVNHSFDINHGPIQNFFSSNRIIIG